MLWSTLNVRSSLTMHRVYHAWQPSACIQSAWRRQNSRWNQSYTSCHSCEHVETLWNVTPCSLVDDDTCFGNILHASSKMAPEPWRWRKDVSPKCQQWYTTLHSVTFHTTAVLMETLCPGQNDRKSNTYCNINQKHHVRITTHDPCRCNSWWSLFGFIGCVTFQRNVLRFSNPKDGGSTFSETSENSATRRTNPQGHHLIKKRP